jgi:hypothetical protein
MRLISLILLSIISITFIPGLLYLISIYGDKLQVIVESKGIAPYVGLMGLVISIAKFVYDWSRESTLGFDKVPYVEDILHTSQNVELIRKRYSVKVKRKRGYGTNHCESIIDVKRKDKKIHYRGLWDDNEYNAPITTERKIKLFETLESNNQIFFLDDKKNPNQRPYNEFIDGKIKISIGATNADSPRPYCNKISKIITDARQETSF